MCGLVPRLAGDPAQQPPKLVLLAKLERAETRPFGAGHLCLQLLELLDAERGGHHFAGTTISGRRPRRRRPGAPARTPRS